MKREADIKDSEEDINTLKEFLKDKCDLPAKESRRLAESFVVDFEWHSTKRLSKAFVEGSLQSKLALFQPKVKREDVESIYSAIRKEEANLPPPPPPQITSLSGNFPVRTSEHGGQT